MENDACPKRQVLMLSLFPGEPKVRSGCSWLIILDADKCGG